MLESLWESNLPNIRASIKRDCMVNISKFQRTSNFTSRNRAEKVWLVCDIRVFNENPYKIRYRYR